MAESANSNLKLGKQKFKNTATVAILYDGGRSQFKFKVNTNLNSALVAIFKMPDFKVRFNLKLARRQTYSKWQQVLIRI